MNTFKSVWFTVITTIVLTTVSTFAYVSLLGPDEAVATGVSPQPIGALLSSSQSLPNNSWHLLTEPMEYGDFLQRWGTEKFPTASKIRCSHSHCDFEVVGIIEDFHFIYSRLEIEIDCPGCKSLIHEVQSFSIADDTLRVQVVRQSFETNIIASLFLGLVMGTGLGLGIVSIVRAFRPTPNLEKKD